MYIIVLVNGISRRVHYRIMPIIPRGVVQSSFDFDRVPCQRPFGRRERLKKNKKNKIKRNKNNSISGPSHCRRFSSSSSRPQFFDFSSRYGCAIIVVRLPLAPPPPRSSAYNSQAQSSRRLT